jgi:predicted AAA+ superfamily ATPase
MQICLHIVRRFDRITLFDTGFVSYYRGLHDLTTVDTGLLWEHYVLNEIQANLQARQIRYWRDKQGHEVDFIIVRRGQPPLGIEAKLNSRNFDFVNLRVFLRQYPQAQAFVVTSDRMRPLARVVDGVSLSFMKLSDFIKFISRQTV